MLTKKVKKLWQGKYLSVRDYELDFAIKQGGLIIEHNNESMTIDLDNCKKIAIHGTKSQKFKSKTGGKDYHLIDITFKADDENAKLQGKLL